MSTDIVIAGFGGSPILRKSDRGIAAFAQDAVMAALADCGLERDEIDGYVGAPFATNAGAPHSEGGDEISAKTMAAVMGFRHLTWATDLFRRYPADMVASAAQALIAGDCRYVVGLRALYNLQGRSYATSNDSQAYGYDQFTRPYGFPVAGTRFATRAQRHMAQHGLTREDLYEVLALARRHAALNPDAIFHGRPLSREDYLAAPMVASPHGLFDCDMPICGAAAFIMCRAEDLPAGAKPAYVAGWAGFQTPHRVFDMAGVGPADITAAQLYDGFSTMLGEWLEGFGFCPPGQTFRFLRDGNAEIDGKLPLNTFGGSLGEGRMHGMGHLREAYLLASGRAPARSGGRSGPVLVQIGPYDDSSFAILQPEPRRRITPTN